MILELGAGPHSTSDYQVDIAKFPNTTHVLDISVENLPFENAFFDKVIAHQVLEHVPTVIYYKEDGKFQRLYPRVHVMKEVFRVLKQGGIFEISIPLDFPFWAQDPTHVDVPWTESTFDYFCGGWGGNVPGDFAKESYGIDFQFKLVERKKGVGDFFNLYVTLVKP